MQKYSGLRYIVLGDQKSNGRGLICIYCPPQHASVCSSACFSGRTLEVFDVQGTYKYVAPSLVFKEFSDCVLILRLVQQPRDVAALQDRQGLYCSLCFAFASSKRRRRSCCWWSDKGPTPRAEDGSGEGDRRQSTMSGVERLAALRQTADNLIRKMQMFSASVDEILTQGPHARHNDALAAHFPSHPSTLDALAHDASLRASLQERAAGMIARLEPWYGLMLDIALFDQQATKALKETAEKAPVVSVRCS